MPNRMFFDRKLFFDLKTPEKPPRNLEKPHPKMIFRVFSAYFQGI
jgi:hypothetical protein